MYIKCGTAKSLYPDKTIDQNAVPKRVRAESARSQRVEKLPSYTRRRQYGLERGPGLTIWVHLPDIPADFHQPFWTVHLPPADLKSEGC